ncbi:reverse transcriptase-like protein [Arthrobacter sp. H5]|uniref:reverse transcriptase-like protein n=1 Tax=Arthrobacter sp. H5 TaxID=1267973 RepID=UPI0004B468C7|nr:reverse transcriptase-like protein [Arthrobacter sp. H5]
MGKLIQVPDSEATLFEDTTEPTPGANLRLLIVEADGGSRGNPGHAGYGALVRDPETGTILVEKAAYLGKASNNVAEYSGLVAGLELADRIDSGARIHVKMDSKLVVEQMEGRWKIKHADMRSLAMQARKTVDPRRVSYEWIPRERNKDADRLSNEAMDAGMAGVDWVPREVSAQEPGPSASTAAAPKQPQATGTLHHVEVWVANLQEAKDSLGWLLERLGFQPKDQWNDGASWAGAGIYVVIESGPDVAAEPHQRRRPGVNHLAFNAGSRAEVDLLARRAASHGWSLLFADRHPFAGGPDHYAAYVENSEGFEVELVAQADA